MTVESQVKNEYAKPKTLQYQVVVEDLNGKVVKTIDGGRSTLSAGEVAIVRARARLEGLNFWSWGYGYLYTVRSILVVDGKVNGRRCDANRLSQDRVCKRNDETE